MKRRRLIVLLLTGVLLVLFFYPKIYVVTDRGGGRLYWNSNEALLFVSVGRAGVRFTPFTYLVNIFRESLRGVRLPDDKGCLQTSVIQMTDKNVQRFETDIQRHLTDSDCFGAFVLFESHIYSGYLAQGKLWKWSGTHFEPATPEEVRAFDAAKAAAKAASTPHPWEFDNVDGWSMRELGLTPPKHELLLNGRPITIIFHGRTWPPRPLSVELIRSGQPPHTIWTLDERPHLVSKPEYYRSFSAHHSISSPE